MKKHIEFGTKITATPGGARVSAMSIDEADEVRSDAFSAAESRLEAGGMTHEAAAKLLSLAVAELLPALTAEAIETLAARSGAATTPDAALTQAIAELFPELPPEKIAALAVEAA